MAILRADEIRDMTPAEREAELEDLETELLNARSVKAAGGAPENPGRIKELRRTIARLKTIQREEGDVPRTSETASGGSREQGDLQSASEAASGGSREAESSGRGGSTTGGDAER